jgi:hydrogenase expression/formation protein HypC
MAALPWVRLWLLPNDSNEDADMCLAVPGQVIEIARNGDDPITGLTGTVDFQGSQLAVSLAMIPEVTVGDWVLVHTGYAISILDEAEARATWEYLEFEDLGSVPEALRQRAKDEEDA